MAQSDLSLSATTEIKIDSPEAVFRPCLQIPGGDGGGFHVARGGHGASWNPATSRPGTCQGGVFACWHCSFAGPSTFARPTGTGRRTTRGIPSVAILRLKRNGGYIPVSECKAWQPVKKRLQARRVRARGLHFPRKACICCRPGALTGPFLTGCQPSNRRDDAVVNLRGKP